MTRTITTTITLLVATAFILSTSIGCKKEEEDRKDFDRIYNCHNESSPTVENVTTRVTGLWWLYQYENYGSGQQTITPDYDVFLELEADSSYSLTEDGKEIATGTWKVTEDNGNYSLDLSTPTAYTAGYTYICIDGLIFSNGHLDGNTYYFSKTYK